MYTVTAEKSRGCFAYDSIYIDVNTSPPINLGADTSFCFGDSIALNAGSGFVDYSWSNGQTAQTLMINRAGTYSVIATDINNCSSKDTLKVLTVFDTPVINLSKDSLLCNGTNKSLTAADGMNAYLWNTGATSSGISVNATGTYWVNVIDKNGCRGSDTARITRMLPLPAAFLPIDTVLCSYSKLKISPNQTYSSYVWSTGSSQSTLTIDHAGTYWLKVKDNFNCMGTDTIVVNPKQCLEGIFVPTAFTPNNDGKNDIFRPLLFGVVVNMKFIIYNKWGQKVYETIKQYEGWNGKVSGIDTDSNVFVWTCEYQFDGQDKKFAKGTVVLIR
jgi:gliding motility-associated-like protein